MSAGGYPEHLTDPDEIDAWLDKRDRPGEQQASMVDADVELTAVLRRIGAHSTIGPRPEVAASIAACCKFRRHPLPMRWWLVFIGQAPAGWRKPADPLL